MPTCGALCTTRRWCTRCSRTIAQGSEDRDHDADDRAAGRRITSPLLVISLLQDDRDLDYGTDILEIWRDWATEVQGAAIDCGHHVAEEKPDELARLVRDFLSEAFQ